METTACPGKDISGDSCVICLSSITERAVTNPCNHTQFDFICLASWLQDNTTCPLCKTDVSSVEYDWRSPTDFKTYTVHKAKPVVEATSATTSTTTLSQHHRFYTHRRPRPPRRPLSPPNPNVAVLRRKHVYRHKLYSLYVGANRLSRYTNWDPQMMTDSHDLQSRARMFVRRELRVFAFLYNDAQSTMADGPATSSNAEWLLSYTLSVLKTVDIKASNGHAEDLLSEFLGRESAKLFLHELNAWLRSPYTKLEDWDRHVQYSETLPTEFDEEGMPVRRGKQGRFAGRSRSPGVDRRQSGRQREDFRRHQSS